MAAGAPPLRWHKGGAGELNSEPMPVSKKRKQRSTDIVEEVGQIAKFAHLDQSCGESEESFPWRNLQLILSLQDKNVDLLKKVNLAFDYVKSGGAAEMDDIGWRSQVIDTSRTIVFLNNWVQSVLISSEKKMRQEKNKPEFATFGSFLDLRCWKILHFCLEESKILHITLRCSKDFLRVIHSIAMDSSSCLNNTTLCCEERLQLYYIVLDCISLVFSFHGGVANENLDLWILLMDEVLKLILKMVADQLDGSKLGNFLLQLSCQLFEPFAKFLRIHPSKNVFGDFIDKLLEPLLHLLHVLHSSSCGSNIEWRTTLSKLVEEVLAQGLFHPTHIDKFLSLQSTDRYRNSSDATVMEEKSVNKSYHRHLFNKVEKIVANKNGLALIGLGELLHLFVSCCTKHKGASVSNMDAELRKSFFDYFVKILEYLLADLNKYVLSDGEVVSTLFNVSSTLKSIDNLLASFICDKLYLRTEDTSEGASRNFLRVIYDTVMSFSAKIAQQNTSSFGSDERSHLIIVKKELIVAVHHLFNIEYEVVGDDLESLWTMVLSSVACCYSSMDVLGQPLLSTEILSLGCRLIDLYSELRQVDSCIFALCRSVRQSLSLVSGSSHSNSLSMLFCSFEFRLSFSNAIKSIPEGQASGFIRQLNSDITESLEWMELEITKSNEHICDTLHFGLQAELLGKVLSEAYIIILDSITITSGNSYLVGVSVKNLIEIIQPSLCSLVSPQPDGSKEFSILVNGITLSNRTGCDNMSICWILVVFFRLLLTCRNLSRQAISVMPPDASKKMSRVIGDSFIVQSGRDWLEMTGSADKGFFPWILQPSETLLNVIHSVSDICIQDSVVLCSPMLYVLNMMALQRLVDLNRLIRSSEYMFQWNQTQGQTKLKDDDDEEKEDTSTYHKRTKKWIKSITKMRKEAARLAKFMMGFLSTIAKDQIFAPSYDGGKDEALIQALHKNDALHFSVGSLDEKLLPSALWWVICRSVDIWCSHAAKKDLKKFLTLLIEASVSCINNDDDGHFQMDNLFKPGHLKKVSAHQIAMEFLSNTILYEQRFIHRLMASRFCRILEKSVLSVFATSGVDLSKSPDWVEVISAVENSSDVQIGSLPSTELNVPAESCKKQINVEFATCQYLLTLLMRMPEEFLSLKSSSLYITYILNLERLLVGSLLEWHSNSCPHNPHQIFRLFVTCRRVLQTLTVALSNENANGGQPPVASRLAKCSFPLPWLPKSLLAVIGFQRAFSDGIAFEDKVAIFSLLDHTSNVLLTISRDQFEHAISSLVSAKKRHRKRKNLNPATEEPVLSDCNSELNPKENLDAWQSVLQLAETLEEHLQISMTAFRDESLDKKVECLAEFNDFNKLSSIVACCQGLLWGLASTLGDTNAVSSKFRVKFSSYNGEPITRIKSCVDTCVNFTTFFLKTLFLEDEPMIPCDKKDDLTKCDLKRKSHPALSDLEAFLTEAQHKKLSLKRSLLMQVLGGENAEGAFFLRQLFISCSAILRLNSQIDLNSIPWSLFPLAVDISLFLLLEFSRSEMPHQSAFLCLDGAVKFIEELGNYFPQFDPSSSRDFFVKLIGLHLRVIGKCISLQGKEAKLASQETGAHAKKLTNHVQSCFSWETSRLGELKERLRMSFITFIKKSSEFHLLSTIQSVERALVGVQEGLITNYEIVCGSSNGGEVSSVVAAGIDALDLILEFVTGPKRLNMMKRHIQSFVASLFNIVLHLQGPSIYYGYVDSVKAYEGPDSGSVILMCIDVLTKISAKPSFFQIDVSQIAQSLRIPGALFQYFLQLQISEAPVKAGAAVDQKFSVELYAACCRVLCTALKHHKSETRQCISLLEDSISVLLHCLEIVNIDGAAIRESFAWEIQEAVKCASSLRRVYEEVRQQKDVFGQCSFQFLSRYIWVYCGFSPARKGILREVDEALRPGLYALIDSCSADDLQLLHTVFGEGPCRSSLAALQHDYKINFQFEGKV